ncbi:MAG: hypothetical protein WCH60_09830 [Burkholderiales bacterium]
MSGRLGKATESAIAITINNDNAPAITTPVVQIMMRKNQWVDCDFLREVALSGACGLEVGGIKVSDGRVDIIKIQEPVAYWKQATALLPQLGFPTKSVDSFLRTGKTVCF